MSDYMPKLQRVIDDYDSFNMLKKNKEADMNKMNVEVTTNKNTIEIFKTKL